MQTIIIKDNQSLLDIAMQETGTAANLLAIAKANDLSLTDDMEAGDKLFLPDGLQIESKTIRKYKTDNIRPATAQLSPDIEALVAEGDIDDGALWYLMTESGYDAAALVTQNDDDYLLIK